MRFEQAVSRRKLLQNGAALLGACSGAGAAFGDDARRPTLLSVPIELAGNWRHMIPGDVIAVLERMRRACLDGVRLVSDDQPDRLRVDEHSFGPPAVWLHFDNTRVGWVIVDVGDNDWSKLAYQFGHELGHVTANSWRPDARPAPPCQWLEEAMVEAFSLRGLALLADDWSRNPPFPNDSGFGASLAVYRQKTVEQYGKLARDQGNPDNMAAWFRAHRQEMESRPGLNDFAKAACVTVLTEYERDPPAIEALGALNRWPGRTAIPLEDYLKAWKASCSERGASKSLPERLQELLIPG